MVLRLVGTLFIGMLCGCATSFTGAAHFPGGARGCYGRCAADGLEFVGVVYMGEYSTACVCERPVQHQPPQPTPTMNPVTMGSIGPAVVGVELQRRASATGVTLAALGLVGVSIIAGASVAQQSVR